MDRINKIFYHYFNRGNRDRDRDRALKMTTKMVDISRISISK